MPDAKVNRVLNQIEEAKVEAARRNHEIMSRLRGALGYQDLGTAYRVRLIPATCL